MSDTRPAPDPVQPCAAAAGWLELEMVNEQDQPLADEPFIVRLPDATVRKGKLDADGYARVTNLPEGEVEVSFPRLDADAWTVL